MPRPSSPLSAKASTRCPSLRLSATPNGKDHRQAPRAYQAGGWPNDAPAKAGAHWGDKLSSQKTLTASHRQPARQTRPSAARGLLPAKPRFARRSRRLLAQSPDTASVTQLASLRFAINNTRRHPQRMRRRHISFRCRVFGTGAPDTGLSAFASQPPVALAETFGFAGGGGAWWRCLVEVPGEGAWWRRLVEVNGFEPMTSGLQSRRSPS